MTSEFSERTRTILALAEREARRLGHDYIGTEHLLLGLVEDGAGVGADVLETLGVTPVRLRAEIEKLVQEGDRSAAATIAGDLPLTPRARKALEYAGEEAAYVGQQTIDSEHLLLGLLREPGGVAIKVLENLGLSRRQVFVEAFKTRMQLMKIIERAMRPVRATVAWKRKRREEMLAHLTTIFDEEYAHSHDAQAAAREAEKRFGEATALSRELQSAVPWSDRAGCFVEKYVGWRAPETAKRWMLRVTGYLAAAMACAMFVCLAIMGAATGVAGPMALGLWPAVGCVVIAPLNLFACGVLYYKIRDAHYGVFGSPKSRGRAVGLTVVVAITVFVGGALFWVLESQRARGVTETLQFLISWAAASAIFAGGVFGMAWWNGPTEIWDTAWACLDVNGDEVGREGGDGKPAAVS